jgi:hypothetical protein
MPVVSRAVRKNVCFLNGSKMSFRRGKADSLFPGNLIVTAIVVRELKNEGGSD